MKKIIISIAFSILSNLVLASSALAASALPVTAPASAEAGSRAADCDNTTLRPEQFEVAIDRASGIAFVHTPCGWTYMGVVKRESIASRRSNAAPAN